MTTHDALTKLGESAEYHILRVRVLEGEHSQMRRTIAQLRRQLAQVRHGAFQALATISEMEPETHDIEEAINIAKERLRYFAPPPTDHTNQ